MCASAATSPTISDVRALNILLRSTSSEPCGLKYWPLKGKLRLVGYPDADYMNNIAKQSQIGQTICLAETTAVSNVVLDL